MRLKYNYHHHHHIIIIIIVIIIIIITIDQWAKMDHPYSLETNH